MLYVTLTQQTDRELRTLLTRLQNWRHEDEDEDAAKQARAIRAELERRRRAGGSPHVFGRRAA